MLSILSFFKARKASRDPSKPDTQDCGILIFDNTSEVIRAEEVLKGEGWKIRVMGPPPDIRTGCDLVIQFPLIEELNILRTIEAAGAEPLRVVPVNGPLLQPVDIFQTRDYGRYFKDTVPR